MPGETDLHKLLKKEACRWLFRMGYRAIAAEVRLNPLGIVDAVGVGVFPGLSQLSGYSARTAADLFHRMQSHAQ